MSTYEQNCAAIIVKTKVEGSFKNKSTVKLNTIQLWQATANEALQVVCLGAIGKGSMFVSV